MEPTARTWRKLAKSRGKNEKKLAAQYAGLSGICREYRAFRFSLGEFIKTGDVNYVRWYIHNVYGEIINDTESATPYVVALLRDVGKFYEMYCKMTGHTKVIGHK